MTPDGSIVRTCCVPGINQLLLFRVDQFNGVALGVLRDIDDRNSLVAILGINSYLLDIMPAELRAHSEVLLELSNGSDVGRFSLKRPAEFAQMISFDKRVQPVSAARDDPCREQRLAAME